MTILIRDIMTPDAMTVSMDDTLLTAYTLFKNLKFHHLLVVEDRMLVGVISDRDVLKWISPHLDTPAETTHDVLMMRKHIHQIMSRKPVTVTADTSVSYAGNVMLENHVSCLPVVNEHNHPIGIVSWRDLLSAYVMLQDA